MKKEIKKLEQQLVLEELITKLLMNKIKAKDLLLMFEKNEINKDEFIYCSKRLFLKK